MCVALPEPKQGGELSCHSPDCREYRLFVHRAEAELVCDPHAVYRAITEAIREHVGPDTPRPSSFLLGSASDIRGEEIEFACLRKVQPMPLTSAVCGKQRDLSYLTSDTHNTYYDEYWR